MIIRVAFPCLLVAVWFSVSRSAVAQVRTLDLYIVAGQSNAVGADTDPAKLPADPNDSDVLFWWKCGDPPADNHDSSSGNSWLTLMPQQLGDPIRPRNNQTRQYGNFASPSGGFGPEIGLARTIMARRTDVTAASPAIAVLKVAYSGTSVENDWNPEQADQPGNCLGTLIDQFERAKEKAESLGFILRPKALLWIQGESDSDAARLALYASRLTSTIQAIRVAVDQPELPVRLAVNTKFGSQRGVPMDAIVAAQKAVAGRDAHCRYVDTSSATIANNAHFDTAGTLLVGKLLADSLDELAGESDGPSIKQK